MMPCIVSWGVCAGRTASAMLTTPCAVITPGTTSSVPAAWKSTSLTASSSTRLSRWYCTPIMKSIDIHAHLVPRSLWQAVDARREWYGFRHEPGDGLGTMLGNGKRTQFNSPKVRFTPEERLKDMDAQGVDVQVVSIHTPFFGYHLDPAPRPPPLSWPRARPRRVLSNAVGVSVAAALAVALLVFGGLLDACPGLRVCVARGGGPGCFAMGGIARSWHGTPEARGTIPQPP